MQLTLQYSDNNKKNGEKELERRVPDYWLGVGSVYYSTVLLSSSPQNHLKHFEIRSHQCVPEPVPLQ